MQIKLNEVQQRLSEIDATKFHKMVDTYLNKKYNYTIHSTGTKTGEDKPRKGTPDTLIALDNGAYIEASIECVLYADSSLIEKVILYGLIKKENNE